MNRATKKIAAGTACIRNIQRHASIPPQKRAVETPALTCPKSAEADSRARSALRPAQAHKTVHHTHKRLSLAHSIQRAKVQRINVEPILPDLIVEVRPARAPGPTAGPPDR